VIAPAEEQGKSLDSLSSIVSDASMRSMLNIYTTHRVLSATGYWRWKSGSAFKRSTTTVIA
jgi:hypothetical protein